MIATFMNGKWFWIHIVEYDMREEYVWKTLLLSLVSERIKYLFALYQCSIEGIEDTLQIIHLNHVIELRKSIYMLSLKDPEVFYFKYLDL